MLKGKTALVTGSTSGIGLGIAKALARQGANSVLNGFGDSEGPMAEVAALPRQAMGADHDVRRLGRPPQPVRHAVAAGGVGAGYIVQRRDGHGFALGPEAITLAGSAST